MGAQKGRKTFSVNWPEKLHEFVNTQLREETKLKISASTELAMEKHLKEIGLWEQYQEFSAA